ncbi:MAG: YegP family protein [Sphingobium sp.]
MPDSMAFSEFEPPRRGAEKLPLDITPALFRIGHSQGAAHAGEGRLRPQPVSEPYFEIYRAERVSLTSILFSGGDWRWRFCSASGQPIAVSSGYASERACASAVAALRGGAGAATVRGCTD